jgi:Fe-S-cluster containining protein
VARPLEPEALRELELQVERGNLFAHTLLTEQAARVNQTEAVVNGLIDLLVRLDVVQADELVSAVETIRKEIKDAGKQASVDIAVRADGEAAPVPAEAIDCEARLPHCKAVCCRLRFALTVEEIESGPVKWDLGRPYFNRHGPNGYCHQIDGESLGCSVYEDRPLVCRQYSCAGDARIWKDFDAMEINQEWIDGHLGAERSPIEIFMSAAGLDEPR